MQANIVRFCPASNPSNEVGPPLRPRSHRSLPHACPSLTAPPPSSPPLCHTQVGRLPLQLAQVMAPLLRKGLLKLSGSHLYSAQRLDMLAEVLLEITIHVRASAFDVFNSSMADDDPNAHLCDALYNLLHYHLYGSFTNLTSNARAAASAVAASTAGPSAADLDAKAKAIDESISAEGDGGGKGGAAESGGGAADGPVEEAVRSEDMNELYGEEAQSAVLPMVRVPVVTRTSRAWLTGCAHITHSHR